MTLLIIYIAGKMTKPINKLAKAATKFAARDFTPVEIKGSDEITQLSESFNNMGVQLRTISKGRSNLWQMCPMS